MSDLTRRDALAMAAAGFAFAGTAGAVTAGEHGKMPDLSKIKLGAGGVVLKVPENQPLIDALEKCKNLTPQELLQVASQYMGDCAKQPVGLHLGYCALQTVFASKKVSAALKSIGKTEVEFSIFDDIRCAICGWLNLQCDGCKKPPSPAKPPMPPCMETQHRCSWFQLYERSRPCGSTGAWSDWRFIGLCFGI